MNATLCVFWSFFLGAQLVNEEFRRRSSRVASCCSDTGETSKCKLHFKALQNECGLNS